MVGQARPEKPDAVADLGGGADHGEVAVVRVAARLVIRLEVVDDEEAGHDRARIHQV